jgi:hypothetical protein
MGVAKVGKVKVHIMRLYMIFSHDTSLCLRYMSSHSG